MAFSSHKYGHFCWSMHVGFLFVLRTWKLSDFLTCLQLWFARWSTCLLCGFNGFFVIISIFFCGMIIWQTFFISFGQLNSRALFNGFFPCNFCSWFWFGTYSWILSMSYICFPTCQCRSEIQIKMNFKVVFLFDSLLLFFFLMFFGRGLSFFPSPTHNSIHHFHQIKSLVNYLPPPQKKNKNKKRLPSKAPT